MLKHAADIGARFSRDVVQFAAAVNRFHDGFRPGGHINLYAAPLSDEQQITCRNSAGLDVAGGVFTTTAERLPISARAIGTIFLVSSALRSKTVAIP